MNVQAKWKLPEVYITFHIYGLQNAVKPQQLGNCLKLNTITNRPWQIQGTRVTTGDGLYEGYNWLGEHTNKKFK